MYRIDREQIPIILFLFLTIVAIGLVASTINSVTGTGSQRSDISVQMGDSGTTDDELDGNFSVGDSGSSGNTKQSQTVNLSICVKFLTRPLAPFAILGMIALGMFGIYYRYNMATAFLFGTGIIPITLFSYFFLTNCIASSGNRQSLLTGSDVISNSQGGVASAPPVPPALMALAFGGIILVAVATLYTMTGEEETLVEPEEKPDQATQDDFARAAGRAANRIEKGNVSVDNSVYQAWLEMTGLFDLENPDTATPLDFVEAATAAGIDENDVRELTRLFTEVRYGDQSPVDREERAMEILRRIQRTYSDDSRGEP